MKVYQVLMIYGDGDGEPSYRTIGIWEKLEVAIEDNKNTIVNEVNKRVENAKRNIKEGSGFWRDTQRMEFENHLDLVEGANKENNYIVIGGEDDFETCNYSNIGGILIQEIELK